MNCPYNTKVFTQVTLIKYDEDDGREIGNVVQQHYQNQKCVKEKCGVWHRGRCRYNE